MTSNAGRIQNNPEPADAATPEGLQRIQAMVKWERKRHHGMVRATLAQRLIDEIYRLRECYAGAFTELLSRDLEDGNEAGQP